MFLADRPLRDKSEAECIFSLLISHWRDIVLQIEADFKLFDIEICPEISPSAIKYVRIICAAASSLALCLWHGGVRCAFGHTSVQGRGYSEKYRSPRQSLTVIHGSYSLPAVIALSE